MYEKVNMIFLLYITQYLSWEESLLLKVHTYSKKAIATETANYVPVFNINFPL